MAVPCRRHEALCVLALGGSLACSGEDVSAQQQDIVGGQTTLPGDYPATGALTRGGTFRCTATLIAPDVILTAAHCLEDVGFGGFAFTLDNNLPNGFVDNVEHLVPVRAFYQHPDFNQSAGMEGMARVNDIGVAILEWPILGVPVAQLDTTGMYRTGSELSVCGYGLSKWYKQSTVGIKREATVVVDRVSIWELSTMAQEPEPCFGDSGGPLFVETQSGWRLAALVSRSGGTSFMCDTGAIATRVGPYREWIVEAAAGGYDTGCSVGSRPGGRGAMAWLLGFGLALAIGRRAVGR